MRKYFIGLLILFVNMVVTCIVWAYDNYQVHDSFDSVQNIKKDEVILFIVDYSESMNEYFGKEKKIDVALNNLAEILPKMRNDVKMGLRTYGTKGGLTVYSACRDSRLVVAPKFNAVNDISNAVFSLKPSGVTPITYSLKKAVNEDLIGYNGKKHIILISDGKENCDESPCDFAIELMKQRNDIKIDVIALGIDDEEALKQLKCAALTTSGTFYKTDTSAQLLENLQNSLDIKKEVQGHIIVK